MWYLLEVSFNGEEIKMISRTKKNIFNLNNIITKARETIFRKHTKDTRNR